MKYINKTRHVDQWKNALDLIPSITQSAVVHTYNDNTQKVEAEIEVQGHFSLCNKLKATMGYEKSKIIIATTTDGKFVICLVETLLFTGKAS